MKTITTNLKYAYVKDIVLLPNISFTETQEVEQVEGEPPAEPTTIEGFKSRISISYDIKDENGGFVDKFGNKVDASGDYVVETQPFLDDNGQPIILEDASANATTSPEPVSQPTESTESAVATQEPVA
jgi:hypothetical protein